MTKSLTALFLLYAASVFPRGPVGACCEMNAKLEGVASSNAAPLKVTITNVGNGTVLLFTTLPELDLRIHVTDKRGRESERTEYGEDVVSRERSGSRINKELRKGESISQVVDLRKLFLLAPGEYSVSISRDVFIGENRTVLKTHILLKIM